MDELTKWLKGIGMDAAGKLLTAVIFTAVGLLLIRSLMILVKRMLAATKLEKAAHTLILSLARAVLGLLLVLTVASALGVDVTGVVALASVLTLAVSLALQNMLANVLGGFTILSTHPFRSGDFVEIAGQSGTVEEIGMAYTKLATADNKQVSIPNSAVVAAQIVNYTAGGTRRVAVDLRASYEVPPQKVIDALVLAGTVDKVLLEPAPTAVVTGFGESAIEYSLRVWTKAEDYWDVFFAVNQKVCQVFAEQSIPVPYPQLQIHMEK